jgi:S-adenosylmethionine hydrolase
MDTKSKIKVSKTIYYFLFPLGGGLYLVPCILYLLFMIVLFTDFGIEGPYIGQMKSVLYRQAPNIPVIDLFSDVPPFGAQGASYLLAAYVNEFPEGTIFLCVVDPGVGSDRRAALVQAGGRWFVGPDNGLFNTIATRASMLKWWDITWQPENCSNSFHGRDIFAPVSADLALGKMPDAVEVDPVGRLITDWPDDLARVVYIDRFGNAMTGIRASHMPVDAVLEIHGQHIKYARIFAEVSVGEAFWYENANGLVEIAVNQGRTDDKLGVKVGDTVLRFT